MAAGDIKAIPAAAAGITITSDPTTAWVYGAEGTIIAASAISVPIYLTYLWVQQIDSAGPDATYQSVFSILINDVEQIIIPFSWRTDTSVGNYFPDMPPPTFVEPYEVPANASVKIKVAASTVRTYTVKLQYVEGASSAVAGIPIVPRSRRLMHLLGR